jgi:two-component system sensor histidine kinase KdpD
MNDIPELLRHRPRDPGDGRVPIGMAAGALSALVIAGALAPLRDHLPNADMALALVLPVLLGAIVGGRAAGALTAVVSALTFDFVFTQPYLSLRIENKDDIWTFVFLLIVALVAAEVGIRGRRGGVAETTGLAGRQV